MNSLLGAWVFVSMLYNDSPLPAPNPDLVMTFEFHADNTNTLRYYRQNELGFCERKADYVFDGQKLQQTVTWVHPDNAIWCSNDSDMRLGTSGSNPARLTADGKFQLDLPLGEEWLTLIWEQKACLPEQPAQELE